VGTHQVKLRYAKQLRSFGVHLKKVRNAKGLTQEDLAYKAGISFSSLNTIENGKLNPTLATLMAISESLKVELPELLDY
jgi:transcriptional regulator with XRE-family HTH domain